MKVIKVVLCLVRMTLSLLSFIFTPLTNWLFSLVYDGSARTVPTVQDELLLLSATQLARKIRSRELTAVSVLEHFIARVCEVHPYLNAVIARRFDEALQEAGDLDEVLDKNPNDEKFSEKNTPLLGVPFSVKEAFAVKGMPNASGLVSRKDYVCEQDCPVVMNMRRAGAIPFSVTNVSELCMWYESSNRLYGRTNNAYNTSRMVGGSSGGEACHITSGGAVIGIGSDIGGSIRMPAFFNGIFGHRPSRGLVSNVGQFPIPTGSDMDLLSSGPLCRYMEDILPMLTVLAGSNAKLAHLDKQVDVKKLCIYNVVDDGGSLLVSSVDPQLKEAQAKVAQFLRETVGAEVKTITIPKFKHSGDMWTARMTKSGGTKFCEYLANQSGSLNPYMELLKWLVGQSNHTLPAIALGCIEGMDHLLDSHFEYSLVGLHKLEVEMAELLGDNGVMLYPSHPKLALYHNQPLLYPMNWSYTAIFNALGLPVTQVPLGLSREGLPLGVQIAGGMDNDHLTIAVADTLARAGVAGWVNPGS